MKGMCGKCKKRKTCKKLCRKAEEYVNQDFWYREERLVETDVDLIAWEHPDDDDFLPNFDNKTIVRKTILLLSKDGKSSREIAKLVPYSDRHIRRIIEEYLNGGT